MIEPETEFRYFAASYCFKLEAALMGLDSHMMFRAMEAIRCCKGTVWLIGNGGSAALASHMATDLQLAGVRAQSLTDVAAITTYANDEGYAHSFAEQIKRLFKANDILIAISGSGNSMNVNYAAATVKRSGKTVIGITGFSGGMLGEECTIHLHVPADHMGRSQDGHQVILHIISYYLMEKLKHDETTRTSTLRSGSPARPASIIRVEHGLDGKHDNLGTGLL